MKFFAPLLFFTGIELDVDSEVIAGLLRDSLVGGEELSFLRHVTEDGVVPVGLLCVAQILFGLALLEVEFFLFVNHGLSLIGERAKTCIDRGGLVGIQRDSFSEGLEALMADFDFKFLTSGSRQGGAGLDAAEFLVTDLHIYSLR